MVVKRLKVISFVMAAAMVLTMVSSFVPEVGYRDVEATGDNLAGSGTVEDPYKIADYADLKKFAEIVNKIENGEQPNADACAVLTKDIDANGAADWVPIGDYSPITSGDRTYKGIFDGKGHTIKGLENLESSGWYALGLFGFVSGGGIVSNVILVDAKLTNTINVGGIAGIVGVNGDNNNTGTIINCGNIVSSGATATVSGYTKVGGIVGALDNGRVINCYNKSNVKEKSDNYGTQIGGIVGQIQRGTIENCYNTGTISGKTNTAGVTGAMSDVCTITNCYNKGNVVGSGSCIGGLVGSMYENGKISNCYNIGNIGQEHIKATHVGGLAGMSNGSISCCYNTGHVTGLWYVGGVAGAQDQNEIKDCYNTGEVEYWGSTSDYPSQNVGGIVGGLGANMSNCLNTGILTVPDDGTISKGALAGNLGDSKTIKDSYFDKSVVGDGVEAVGKNDSGTVDSSVQGLSTAKLKGSDCPALNNWLGSEDNWCLSDGYPELRAYTKTVLNTGLGVNQYVSPRPVDTSKILFSSVITPGAEYGDDAKYKFTEKVSDIKIVYDSSKEVTSTDREISVPYKVTLKSGAKANRVSYLITEGAYDVVSPKIRAYGKMTDTYSASGTGTIPLTAYDPDKDFIYIFAEQENGKYETDYASGLIQIKDPKDLHVGDDRVSLRKLTGKGNVTGNEGEWRYNPCLVTLTLDNYKYNGAGHIESSSAGAIFYNGTEPLFITVKGRNSIVCEGSNVNFQTGIIATATDASVKLSGESRTDTLGITVSNSGKAAYCYFCLDGNLSFENVSAEFKCIVNKSENITHPIRVGGSLSVKNSDLTCLCDDSKSACRWNGGILAEKINISDKSMVTAKGGRTKAISDGMQGKELSVKDSTIIAEAGPMTNELTDTGEFRSAGIYVKKDADTDGSGPAITIENSSVTAIGGNVPVHEYHHPNSYGLYAQVYGESSFDDIALLVKSGSLEARGGAVEVSGDNSYGIFACSYEEDSNYKITEYNMGIVIEQGVKEIMASGHTSAFAEYSENEDEILLKARIVTSVSGITLPMTGWTDYDGTTGKAESEITNDYKSVYDQLPNYRKVMIPGTEPAPPEPTPPEPTPPEPTPTPAQVEVESLALDVATVTLECGQTYTFTPAISPSDATDKTLTWKTGNKKVATVSSDGTVTGVGKGTTTITATTSNGKTATCKVKVKEYNDIKRVYITPAGIILKAGKTKTVRAIILPTKAKNKRVTWKSSNPKVATVTPVSINKAKITAVKKGTAKITVTTADSRKKRTIKVTVKKK